MGGPGQARRSSRVLERTSKTEKHLIEIDDNRYKKFSLQEGAMSIVGEFKEIGSFLQKAGSIDLYNKLIAIQEKDLELMAKNQQLQEENGSLKQELGIRGLLQFRHDAYWLDQEGGTSDGPFCSKCRDDEKKLIRLVFCPDPKYSMCPKCSLVVEMERRVE